MNAYVHKKTREQMYTAALFTMDSNWNQHKYPSAGEWRNTLDSPTLHEWMSGSTTNGILVSNKKKWTPDTCNDMNESHRPKVE